MNITINSLKNLARDMSKELDRQVPLLDEIMNGVVEAGDEGEVDKETKQPPEDKGIPYFWLLAMKNNEVLAKEITERDEGALEYLKDVKWSRLDGAKGFKLDFFFETNPYFSNSVLTKTYLMISEDEHILENAIGTEIEWFPRKSLTQKILKKKPKKGSNDTKPIIRIEECESFFLFFDPPQLQEDEGEIDEEAAELLQSQLEQDYEIGNWIGKFLCSTRLIQRIFSHRRLRRMWVILLESPEVRQIIDHMLEQWMTSILASVQATILASLRADMRAEVDVRVLLVMSRMFGFNPQPTPNSSASSRDNQL